MSTPIDRTSMSLPPGSRHLVGELKAGGEREAVGLAGRPGGRVEIQGRIIGVGLDPVSRRESCTQPPLHSGSDPECNGRRAARRMRCAARLLYRRRVVSPAGQPGSRPDSSQPSRRYMNWLGIGRVTDRCPVVEHWWTVRSRSTAMPRPRARSSCCTPVNTIAPPPHQVNHNSLGMAAAGPLAVTVSRCRRSGSRRRRTARPSSRRCQRRGRSDRRTVPR